MPATARRWTAAEVRALPDDGKRYELVDGELLVTPAPTWRHQAAAGELLLILTAYVRRQRLGEVLFSPADIELEPESIVQPDLFVVPSAHVTPSRRWEDIHSLLLACEVLSPGTARYDRVTKRRFFGRAAVGEYWIVDLDAELIERSSAGGDRVEPISDRLVWQPAGAAEPLVMDLPDFFRTIRGED